MTYTPEELEDIAKVRAHKFTAVYLLDSPTDYLRRELHYCANMILYGLGGGMLQLVPFGHGHGTQPYTLFDAGNFDSEKGAAFKASAMMLLIQEELDAREKSDGTGGASQSTRRGGAAQA